MGRVKGPRDELDVEKIKKRRLRRRLSLMPWISPRGNKMRDRSARTSAVGRVSYWCGQKNRRATHRQVDKWRLALEGDTGG